MECLDLPQHRRDKATAVAMIADPVDGTDVTGNSDCPWDAFDPVAYYEDNYRDMHEADREIIECVRDFFTGIRDVNYSRGIDVGTGANLYPALSMLPMCEEITLWEYSRANVKWLEQEIFDHSKTWDAFWDVFCASRKYNALSDPRAALRKKALVKQASLFDLPVATWDVGTMFFVAESITSSRPEFEKALRCFMNALKYKAPFVIAFMENSVGYKVGSYFFPAIKVDVDIVTRKLKPYAPEVEVTRIESDGLLREGYTGMILARGRKTKR